MSQIISRKVFSYSSASTQHPIEVRGGNFLNPETFSSSYEEAVAESPQIAKDQGSEILFKTQSSDDANAAYTENSTTIVRTFVINGEEKKHLATEAAPITTTTINSNIDRSLPELKEHIQAKNGHSTPAANNNLGKLTNLDSTNMPATTKRSSKTSYTYRVRDGIAVLENVTRYQPEMQTTTNFTTDKPKHAEISNVSLETNTEYLVTDQDHDVHIKSTIGTKQAFTPTPKTILSKLDMVSISENNAKNSSQQKRQLNEVIKKGTQQSTTHSYSVSNPTTSQKNFGSKAYREHSITRTKREKGPLAARNTENMTTQNITHAKSHGDRILIPHLTQQTSTKQVNQNKPSTKDQTDKPDGWVSREITLEEVKSEPPLQAKRLSADKMQFLQSQHKQPVTSLKKTTTGRLVIPYFNHTTFTTEVKEHKPSPKVEKLKTQEWVTQVVTQEEVRSEPLLQANRLSADKMQFLQSQDTQPEKSLEKSSPGRLVIPDFNQATFTTDVTDHKPSPKVDKLKSEQWLTQVVTQEEVRSDPSVQAKRLSADKMQFLQEQETQPEKMRDKSSSGRLVIPDFNQATFTTDVKEHQPSPKVDKLKSEQWLTQVVSQEDVSSDPSVKAKRLSADKMQFLQGQETQPEKMRDKSSPGRLLIPVFNQTTLTTEVKEDKPSPKVEKLKTQEWVTHVVTQEEVRSEQLLQANRLSADKMQFLQSQDTQPEKSLDKSSPGRLVIPDFNQATFTSDVTDHKPSPKVDKLKTEQWVTQVVTKDKGRSDPSVQAKRLSADKMQFLQSQHTQPEKSLEKSSPGRLVIPDFNQATFTTDVTEHKSSPKVDKLKSEQWVTQVVTQEVRSDPSVRAKRLSGDKMQFLQGQDTEPEKKLDKSSPDRLVIPDFNESVFTSEVKEHKPSANVEKLITEEWVAQVVTQKEVKSEQLLQGNRLSADKMEFLQGEDRLGGKILEKKELRDEWKVEAKGNEQWRLQAPIPLTESWGALKSFSGGLKMHSTTTSMLPRDSNKLVSGTDNAFFVQIQEAPTRTGNYKDEQSIKYYLTELPPEKTGFVRSRETRQVLKSERPQTSDGVVIPVEVTQVSSSSGVVIHNSENLTTQTITSRLPAVKDRNFVYAGEVRQAVTLEGTPANGSAVIPVEIKHISSSPKVEMHDEKTWTTRQTSVKLSGSDRFFVNAGETQEAIRLDGSSSSGVVIPTQISREYLTTNVKIHNSQAYKP
ncbi:uncharacterized protein LOC111324008 [Stylophora pistillata]|uniref:uncharacterized protein LOC111324008 n=1 Tax=Stylophora pistillata TaxID=50429 RepID=UPI000C041A04|nr:uncharacterized protein LOC111324008 [Stylophora pistillata]